MLNTLNTEQNAHTESATRVLENEKARCKKQGKKSKIQKSRCKIARLEEQSEKSKVQIARCKIL